MCWTRWSALTPGRYQPAFRRLRRFHALPLQQTCLYGLTWGATVYGSSMQGLRARRAPSRLPQDVCHLHRGPFATAGGLMPRAASARATPRAIGRRSLECTGIIGDTLAANLSALSRLARGAREICYNHRNGLGYSMESSITQQYGLSQLEALEAESIHIIREVA